MTVHLFINPPCDLVEISHTGDRLDRAPGEILKQRTGIRELIVAGRLSLEKTVGGLVIP